MFDSLWPCGLQYARLLCPSLSSRVWLNSCPLSCWCHPTHPLTSPLLLPSVFPSIRIFSKKSVLCVRWPNYWSFSFSISLSNAYSELISFRIDYFDLLAVQWILECFLQHLSLKVSILQCSAFFMVHLSHSYTTTGKTTALTIWTFVRKVISLLFNTLSRFAIVFLPRSKHLVISWLWLLSTVIFGARENKVCHCFHFSSIYLPWSDGTGHHGFLFLNVEFQTSFFLSPLSPSSIGPLVSLHFLS